MGRLILPAMLVAGGYGCGGDFRTPTGVGAADGPGGRGSRNDPAEVLVGSWENIMLVAVPGDLQRWTTTWEFEPQATCRHTTLTESLAEGIPRTRVRDCRYSLNGSTISVTYAGAEDSVDFEFSFAGFSPDRLVLDGFEFERIG